MDLYKGVNYLLNAIGEIPITDNTQALEASATDDVGIARDTLLSMSRSIQSQGYWFNKELDYTLMPNVLNYIPIGESIISIYSPEVIVKDHKLYSITKRTFQFDKPQTVDVIFEIVFDDLPTIAADAIIRQAAVEFYNNVLGDTQELRILQANADRAAVLLQKEQAKHRKTNLIKGSRLVDRRTNPTGV